MGLGVLRSKYISLKPLLHRAFSLPCVGYDVQRKLNVHAMQIVLPPLHFAFSSDELEEDGILFIDYENIFSNFIIIIFRRKSNLKCS